MSFIISKILFSKPSRYLFGLMIMLALYVSSYGYAIMYLANKNFPLDSQICYLYFIIGFVAVITLRIKKIGFKILKHTFLASFMGVGVAYGFHLLHFKNVGIISLGVGLALYLMILAFKESLGLNIFKKQVSVDKTMEEVDALGNGDTYQKGLQFESFVANLYKKMGLEALTTTELRERKMLPAGIQKRGGSGEQGVDVMIFDHRNNQKIVVQCKHYSSNVSNSAVQEIVAAMPLYGASKGIVVTNQYFTGPAIELAKANNIELIDRDALAKFIEVANAGNVKFKKTLPKLRLVE